MIEIWQAGNKKLSMSQKHLSLHWKECHIKNALQNMQCLWRRWAADTYFPLFVCFKYRTLNLELIKEKKNQYIPAYNQRDNKLIN